MSGADALWVAVHAALDARRDPLDDPSVVAALTAAPERLAEVAALRAALCALPVADRGPRRRLRPMLLATAAAVLFLAVGLWPHRDPPAGAPVALAAAAAAPAPPCGAILLARGSSTRSAPPAPAAGVLEHHQLLTIHHP